MPRQQHQLIIPSFSDCFRFKGEYNIIFKIARLLRGGDPAVQISDEVKRIVDTLGEKIIAAVTTPATTQPASERRRERLDDNAEQNNNKDENKNHNDDSAFGAEKNELCSNRCAAALATVMYDQALTYTPPSGDADAEFDVCDLHKVLRILIPSVSGQLNDICYKHLFPAASNILRSIKAELLDLLPGYASPQQQQQQNQQQQPEDSDLVNLVTLVLQSALPPIAVKIHPVRGSCTFTLSREITFDIMNVEYNFDRTAIPLNKDLRDALEAAFAHGESINLESALQEALENCFNGRTFGEGEDAMIIRSTSGNQSVRTSFTSELVNPDFTVFRADQSNSMMRKIAIIEIQRWTLSHPPYDINKHVNQLLGTLEATLMENPFRESVYGILINETCFTMYRVRFLDRRFCFDLVYEKLVRAHEPEDFDEKHLSRSHLLDCMEWFLTRTPVELGLTVPHPTFDPVTGTSSGDFTLGPTLGTGESCRVYSCVEVEKRRTPAGCAPINWSRDHVAKLYASKEDADHEYAMYQRIAASKIENTTRMLARHSDENMIFVTPLATHFRGKSRNLTDVNSSDMNPSPPLQIELSHVNQLIVALRGLHNAGIVHCDMQHQNLLCDVATGTRALVNDFGRAKLRQDMKFCEFRRLVRDDFVGLGIAVKNLQGGEKAWENAMAVEGGTTVVSYTK